MNTYQKINLKIQLKFHKFNEYEPNSINKAICSLPPKPFLYMLTMNYLELVHSKNYFSLAKIFVLRLFKMPANSTVHSKDYKMFHMDHFLTPPPTSTLLFLSLGAVE